MREGMKAVTQQQNGEDALTEGSGEHGPGKRGNDDDAAPAAARMPTPDAAARPDAEDGAGAIATAVSSGAAQ